MISKDEEIPKYDIAIEWVVIIIYSVLFILNSYLTFFLIQGRLKNQRISSYLIPMAIIGLICGSCQFIENNFFHNQFWSVAANCCGYILTLSSVEMNAEILKTFSVLSTFWNYTRVFYLQIILCVIHVILCGGSYIKLALNVGSFASIFTAAESVWMVIAVLNNTLCSMYVVFLVFRDVKGMKSRGKAADFKGSHYFGLIATLIINQLIDFVGIAGYIYTIMTPFPETAIRIRIRYAIQRICTSPLGLHCFIITIIFIQLRYAKFSKEMSLRNIIPKLDPHNTVMLS
ncbi:hypothetical protein BC833DRAFT_605848 [Globomyces pollinis-pini]|nr:hypothetical protein BC833DRAFT_605848 [Globomyces pollinis-pini]